MNQPETPIPGTYSTYTSEGFFALSYPSDWEVGTSAVRQLDVEIKSKSISSEMKAQLDKTRTVLFGSVGQTDADSAYLMVQVQPKPYLPLLTLIDEASQRSNEYCRDYVEFARLRTTVGGREAVVLTYQGYDSESFLLKYTTSFVIGDHVLWAVICMATPDAFEGFADDFDHIIRSLRVYF